MQASRWASSQTADSQLGTYKTRPSVSSLFSLYCRCEIRHTAPLRARRFTLDTFALIIRPEQATPSSLLKSEYHPCPHSPAHLTSLQDTLLSAPNTTIAPHSPAHFTILKDTSLSVPNTTSAPIRGLTSPALGTSHYQFRQSPLSPFAGLLHRFGDLALPVPKITTTPTRRLTSPF